MTLGQQIAHDRKALRMSQSEAARRAAVHRLTWRAWEQDESAPGEHNYVTIEDTLGWARGSVEVVRRGGVRKVRERPAAESTREADDRNITRLITATSAELVRIFREEVEARDDMTRQRADQWLVRVLDMRADALRLEIEADRSAS